MNRQRPTMQAQAQTMQKQIEHLQNGVRQRGDLIEQSEKRLSESYAKLAEMEARRSGFEVRAKELQDQIRDHTKLAADGKREAERITADLSRVQDQSRNLEPQRKELAKLSSLREQGERQLGEVDARLSERRLELVRLQEEIRVREEQRQRLSLLPAVGGDLAIQAKVETLGADAKSIMPKN
jgi:conjugal transfer/entry exclusion protein